jgi:hypothetical protein
MSSRALLSGYVDSAVRRLRRKSDGSVFGVVTIRDEDRGESRKWTCFVSDPDLIERCEKMKIGEPIAIAGPFSVTARGDKAEHRITAQSLIGARASRKKKGTATTQAVADDAELAPRAEGWPFDDPIAF